MGFDHFLGNVQLKQNLLQSLDKGHISHFYLISGPKGSGKHTLARLLAAAILCRQAEKPCMNCSICRRCLEQAHPDFITGAQKCGGEDRPGIPGRHVHPAQRIRS